jgi:polyisoprenoid-binding protein YceI
MTRRLLPIRLLLGCLLLPAAALAADWQLVPDDSSLGFRAEAQGEHFDGRFQRFEATIRFDPQSLDAGRFEVAIALDAVDSQNSERDDMLAEPEFFDSRRQPQAHYRAERFDALGGNRYRASGELELRGARRPVALDFDWQADGDGAVLVGTARLDRLAFGIGSGEWEDTDLIAREVEVQTRLVLRRAE